VVTHTFPQTEISALIELGYEHILCQNVFFFHRTIASPCIFIKTSHAELLVCCGSVKLLTVSCEIVYRWVTTGCSFKSDLQNLCERNRFLNGKHATDLYLSLSVYSFANLGVCLLSENSSYLTTKRLMQRRNTFCGTCNLKIHSLI